MNVILKRPTSLITQLQLPARLRRLLVPPLLLFAVAGARPGAAQSAHAAVAPVAVAPVAAPAAGPAPAQPAPGSQYGRYPLLRVGDLAPMLRFTYDAGLPVDSRQLARGCEPLWVCLPAKTSDARVAAVRAALTAIATATTGAGEGAVSRGYWLLLRTGQTAERGRYDADARLWSAQVALPDNIFDAGDAGCIMGQDSAGFVRRVEPLTPDPELLAAQLRSFRQTFRLPPPPTAFWTGVVLGQVAPDFAVLDSRGELRHLADLRGHKNLLLTFFPKCFTSGCATHLASLRDVYPAFIGNATEVWAVSVDEAAGAEGQLAFAAQLQLPFPLIPDTGSSLSLLYGAVGGCDGIAARLSVLIDKHGVVRLVDTNVRTASHGTDMLNQLTALGMLLPVTEPAPKPAPRPAMTDDSMGGGVAH